MLILVQVHISLILGHLLLILLEPHKEIVRNKKIPLTNTYVSEIHNHGYQNKKIIVNIKESYSEIIMLLILLNTFGYKYMFNTHTCL